MSDPRGKARYRRSIIITLGQDELPVPCKYALDLQKKQQRRIYLEKKNPTHLLLRDLNRSMDHRWWTTVEPHHRNITGVNPVLPVPREYEIPSVEGRLH